MLPTCQGFAPECTGAMLAIRLERVPHRRFALTFLWFAFCFGPTELALKNGYVAGKRAELEFLDMEFLYLWTMLIGMWAIIIISKFYFTLLLLWLIPMYVVIYAFMVRYLYFQLAPKILYYLLSGFFTTLLCGHVRILSPLLYY